MFGIGWPTLLLIVQLGAGLAAAGDLVWSLVRGSRLLRGAAGQALVATVLILLGADGLLLGLDLPGRLAYELDFDPDLIRPGTVGLIVLGTVLWLTER